MINGKVPEQNLFEEKFSYAELYEASRDAHWDYIVDKYGNHTNIGFFIRWLAEWVVLNKREPKYEPGVIYQDHSGYFYTLEVDNGSGEPTGRWASMGTSKTFPRDYPDRPLTPMVPENKGEIEAAVPPKRGGEG